MAKSFIKNLCQFGLVLGLILASVHLTALAGNLPKIVVGSGGLIYELSGTMVGTFQASPQGFAAGSWKAKEVGGSCGASGSWFAYK